MTEEFAKPFFRPIVIALIEEQSIPMFDKLFGGKKEEARKSETGSKSESGRPKETKSQASPSSAAGAPSRAPDPRPSLHVDEESLAAQSRARAAIAALHAAAPSPTVHDFQLPEQAGVRERSAALFSVGEHKQAIDLVVQELNRTSGNSPKPIWFMLMDAYQALGQQAAFEKSAALFANFFKTSPPSWEGREQAAVVSTPSGNMIGRHVLVVDGQPSQIHGDKLKDFVAASREEGKAKLDLSRSRLDEDHALRVDDLRVLLTLMRRLRKHQISTLLMGENQVVEVLRTVIQKDLPVPGGELYWELLLEFMQWRGQEEAFEDLAILFADRFRKSAPGYESEGVVALAPTENIQDNHTPVGLVPPEHLTETGMVKWCEQVEAELPFGEAVLWLDFRNVQSISFDAATHLASRLKSWNRSAEQFTVEQPSELVHALFDITGVSAQVTILPRKR